MFPETQSDLENSGWLTYSAYSVIIMMLFHIFTFVSLFSTVYAEIYINSLINIGNTDKRETIQNTIVGETYGEGYGLYVIVFLIVWFAVSLTNISSRFKKVGCVDPTVVIAN